MAGLVRRKLYKRERRAPRKAGVLRDQAPVGCPDATKAEILTAIMALAREAGFRVGQGGEYYALGDRYTVIGVSLADHKAQDIVLDGAVVAEVIKLNRLMRDGTMDPQTGLLRGMPGYVDRTINLL